MQATIKVDFHCHSAFSDGEGDPETLAQHCAEAGVRYAALTDHATLDGLDRFEAACERLGVGVFNGLELTVLQGQKEIHLLCYGFDRTNTALIRAVLAAREAQLRNSPTYSMTPKQDLPEMIEAVHQAGGIVVLAHPLVTEPDVAALTRRVAALVPAGLDGLEIYHPLMGLEQQAFLRELARSNGLVVSGGTDHHGPPPGERGTLGLDLPMQEWKTFRELLLQQRKKVRPAIESQNLTQPPASPIMPGHGRMHLLIGMVLPALAAVFLFTLALFGFFLPGYEKALMDRKREMIQELTRTVWSLLDEAEKQVQAGRLSSAEAQNQVIERVRSLRYGREGKDYFWLQDLSPRMLMHPYRKDLEGQDLSSFVDARKIHIFTVFADKIRQDKEGYVDYVWQWKDDPSRLEAKESYIRLFEPWGWVIGTGLYIQDVVAEIHALKLRLIYAMGGIIAVLILLLLVILQGGWRSDRLRASAERRLQESHERYLTLVQAAAEGVLFVRNHRCAYANPVFLELAGCSAEELTLFDWQDLFPEISGQDPLFRETGAEVYTDARLRRRDGTVLKCRIAHKGTAGNGGSGFVILVRRSEEGIRSIAAAEGLLKRLLNVPAATAEDIAREIATAATAQDVVDLCRRSPELVRAMLESGSPPIAIAGMISSITDSATIRFIEFAQADLGPPPVGFAFVALGSQGRKEQTLFTDQDNAIVYDTPPLGLETRTGNYFAALAERVCETLTQSGYRECKGLVMAHNLKWCQPVEVWKDYFKNWITQPEAHEMMEFGTFFDLRCVYGDTHLIQILRTHLQTELAPPPVFFTQAARNALSFKPPVRLFGNLVASGGSKEKAGHLDLKTAMMPIVSFARLYALQKNILFTSTQDRLSALTDQGVLLPSQYHDLLTAFETLLRLRLRHQSATIQNGGAPDNLIDPTWLGHIDKAVLKECFKEIDRMQERITRDFLGGEPSL